MQQGARGQREGTRTPKEGLGKGAQRERSGAGFGGLQGPDGLGVMGGYSGQPWKNPRGWAVLGGSLESLGLSER